VALSVDLIILIDGKTCESVVRYWWLINLKILY